MGPGSLLPVFALVGLLPALPAPTSAAEAVHPMIRHARDLLGVPYHFGGRLDAPGQREGIDCQGLLFYAAERMSGCGWRSFSVLPTRSVKDAELGARVPGLDPVATARLSLDDLRPGDILLFVGSAENFAEPSIGKLGETPVWVWHTGLYAGEGNFLVGDHFAGEAVETPLLPYLKEHAGTYEGLFITRMKEGPKPKRCRKHPPMVPPHPTRPAAGPPSPPVGEKGE